MSCLLQRQLATVMRADRNQLAKPKLPHGMPRLLVVTYMTGTGERKHLPRNTIIKFVPQQENWIIERFGKYHKTLEPGLNILVPIIDEVKYVQGLKEIAIEIPQQSAITRDNVTLHLDGVLYFRVFDPLKASYGVEDPQFAITQLAQTTMRSELGKISLDDVFKERDTLNHLIVESINSASEVWGIKCLRYEIRDIQLPSKVRDAMQMQVEAERRKRASVLESEGQREAAINRATGEARAILAKAEARSEAINLISRALQERSGNQAAALSIAEQYVTAFSNLAKTNNTVILPSNVGDVASMVTQAMTVYKQISKNSPDDPPATPHDGTSKKSESSTKDTKDSKLSRSRTSLLSSNSSLGIGAGALGLQRSDLLSGEDFNVASSPTRKREYDASDFTS